jgi:chemotaxis protein histidine kinase CheA
MWDQLREWRKPAAQKRQERITAYVDGALSAREIAQFERDMAEDATLRTEVAQLRAFKAALRAVPPRRVPRNFTLDPAIVGRPEPAGLTPFFPVLRTATALTAFFFVFALGLSFWGSFSGGAMETAMDAEVAAVQEEAEMEAGAANSAAADVMTEESAAPEMMEAPMAEAEPEEAPAEEMAMEAESAPEAEMAAPEATFMLEETKEADGEEEAPIAEMAEEETTAADEEEMSAEVDEAGDTVMAPAPLPTPSPPPTAAAAGDTAEIAAAPDEEEIVATTTAAERAAETTADGDEDAPIVATLEPAPTPSGSAGPAPLTLLQIGLGALLLLLAALTFFARRQV